MAIATAFSSPPHLWSRYEIRTWRQEVERCVHSTVEKTAHGDITEATARRNFISLMYEVNDVWNDAWGYASTWHYYRATRRLRQTCIYLAALLGSPRATQWWSATRNSCSPWSFSEGTLSLIRGSVHNWLNDGIKVATPVST